jgi:hypothetical protein
VILVDTSIWIDLINGQLGSSVREQDLFEFATCGPVVQEVLQGLKDDPSVRALRDSFLELPVLGDPLPLASFQLAAEIFRQGRSKGYTIRSSVDCLIAAVAIQNQVPVWHKDRDFDMIERFTPLRTYQRALRPAQ